MVNTSLECDMNLKGKSLLTLADLSPLCISTLIQKSLVLKTQYKAGVVNDILKGKILGLIFDKPSTRTRVSFEAGMLQLGGQAIYLNGQDLQLGRGEPISDTARVLSSYVDGIMIRTFEHARVETLASYASIPIINGLTDLYHPCQALADLVTIQEIKGKLTDLKVAYIGDGNNVAHSLMLAAAKMGMTFTLATPKGYEPNQLITEKAKNISKNTGAKLTITDNPFEATEHADVIYTDVWTSMGQEEENEKRLLAFKDFQVNTELVAKAAKDYMFLHCLPAHRGEEVTESIIDGKSSYVFQQAENRLHIQKALLAEILA